MIRTRITAMRYLLILFIFNIARNPVLCEKDTTSKRRYTRSLVRCPPVEHADLDTNNNVDGEESQEGTGLLSNFLQGVGLGTGNTPFFKTKQRRAMEEIYDYLNVGYNSFLHECCWIGIECGDGRTVTSIDLSGNSPSVMMTETTEKEESFGIKTIPHQIESLQDIEILNLSFNALVQTIPPGLSNLKKLQELYLQGNELSGTIPSEFTIGGRGNALRNLRVLDLKLNKLTGTIPKELLGGDCDDITNSPLEILQLSGNFLSNTLPTEIGCLKTLKELNLALNEIQGSIPKELGSMSSLVQLDLFGNNLSGSLPSELSNLEELRSLDLYSNEFTGSVPLDWQDMSELHTLDLRDNNLVGDASHMCYVRYFRYDSKSSNESSSLSVNC